MLWTVAILVEMSLWAGLTFAQQPAAWGPGLFASFKEGKEIDTQRALSLTPFYKTPATETSGEPGTLVRTERATDLSLPPGVIATRILYHTRTANHSDALASGVVLVPYGQPPEGGGPCWPGLTAQAGSPRLVLPLS